MASTASLVPVLILLVSGCGESTLGPGQDPGMDERILVARSSAGADFSSSELGWIRPGGAGFEPMGIPLASPLLAVSADRQKIALTSADLVLRTLRADGSALAAIPSPAGAGGPHWSPDGAVIAVRGMDAIYAVPGEGGTPVDISSHAIASDGVCPSTGRSVLRSFGFGADGDILFSNYVCGVGDHFHKVSPDGTQASRHSPDDYEPEWTYWSPDGTRILSEGQGAVFLAHPDGSNRRMLQEGGGSMRTLPSRFSDRSDPWSPDGRLVAFASMTEGPSGPRRVIRVLEVDGPGAAELEVPLGASAHISWSPSGRWLAFRVIEGGSSDLFVADLEEGALTNLTNSPDTYHLPVWVRMP